MGAGLGATTGATTGRRALVVEADGGSRGNPGPAGYGALVRDAATGRVITERAGYLGVTTNNVAEYSGLVAGLRAAAAIDPDAQVTVRMDSRLVVEQMSGRWKIKHDEMRRLAAEAKAAFPRNVAYEWVPRAQNGAADRLANEAMDTAETAIVRDYGAGSVSGVESVAVPAGASAPDGDGGSRTDVEAPGAPGAGPAEAALAGAPVRADDDQPLTVVLACHGPTAPAAEFSGSSVPGPPLSARGRTCAAQLADLAYRIGRDAWTDLPRATAVVASPTARTRETAAAVGRRLGAAVTTDERFAEADLGEWEGLTAAEVDAGWPGLWHAFATGISSSPGGESLAEVGARVWGGLRDLVDGGTGRTVVVVGHAVPVGCAVGTVLGVPPTRWSRTRIAPASVTILRLWADGTAELAAVGVPSDL